MYLTEASCIMLHQHKEGCLVVFFNCSSFYCDMIWSQPANLSCLFSFRWFFLIFWFISFSGYKVKQSELPCLFLCCAPYVLSLKVLCCCDRAEISRDPRSSSPPPDSRRHEQRLHPGSGQDLNGLLHLTLSLISEQEQRRAWEWVDEPTPTTEGGPEYCVPSRKKLPWFEQRERCWMTLTRQLLSHSHRCWWCTENSYLKNKQTNKPRSSLCCAEWPLALISTIW